MGRALGETIAVAMVIGNNYALPHSLLSPGATLGSAIINNFGEANPGLDRSSVIGLVVVLLAITALVNVGWPTPVALATARRSERRHEHDGLRRRGSAAADAIGARRALVRASARQLPGSPPGHGAHAPSRCAWWRWRSRWHRSWPWWPTRPAAASTPCRGASSPTSRPRRAYPGGGISTAIVGSVIIVGVAAVIAVPVGTLAALFLVERRGRLAGALRFGGRRAHRRAVHRARDLRLRRARRTGLAHRPLLGTGGQLRPGRRSCCPS